MYIIPQRAKKSTNKIIKFDKKFTVSGVISIYLAYTIKNEVSNSRLRTDYYLYVNWEFGCDIINYPIIIIEY